MKKLTTANLDDLCAGAALLGSGGGGDTDILRDYAHYLLVQNQPVDIITVDEMDPNSLIVPISLIGAPLVSIERIPSTQMLVALYSSIKKIFPDKKIVLMPAEIGGCNALTPFLLAAKYSLPVLDADLIGRAFPKINMCKPAINCVSSLTAFIANTIGEVRAITATDFFALEQQARQIATEFGCSAAIATFMFEPQSYDKYAILGSISRAFALGEQLRNATGAESFLTHKKIGSGIVTDVSHEIQNGFLYGYAKINSKSDEHIIYFQNEYYAVKKNQEIISETPAIISLIEARSKKVIASESLRFGLAIDIVEIEAPDFWKSAQAYEQVNLSAFGFTKDKTEAVYV